jgi:hypothetical protein
MYNEFAWADLVKDMSPALATVFDWLLEKYGDRLPFDFSLRREVQVLGPSHCINLHLIVLQFKDGHGLLLYQFEKDLDSKWVEVSGKGRDFSLNLGDGDWFKPLESAITELLERHK